MSTSQVKRDSVNVPTPDLDPFSREAILNWQKTNEDIREAGDVFWLAQYGVWATGRFEPAKLFLLDHEMFSSAKRPFNHPDFPLPAILVTDDPPGHGRIRKVMNQILSPQVVRQLSDGFRREADHAVNRVLAMQSFEGFSDLAVPYILKAFGDAVGLRQDGREHLLTFGAAILNTFGPVNSLFLSLVEQSEEATAWVQAQCVKDALKANSIGSAVYEANNRGEVTDEQAALLVMSLLSAGVDTTVSVIVNLLHAFARNPDQYALLREQPSLRVKTINELMRHHSPARVFGRVAKHNVEICGQSIKQDDGVLVFLGSAGRDRDIWPDADRFDITRPASRIISFGVGIHTCVGQMLSRTEIMALLDALVSKVERIELIGEPEIMMSNTITSLSQLPLKFVGN